MKSTKTEIYQFQISFTAFFVCRTFLSGVFFFCAATFVCGKQPRTVFSPFYDCFGIFFYFKQFSRSFLKQLRVVLSRMASLFLAISMALDSYVACVSPIYYRRKFRREDSRILVGLFWVLCFWARQPVYKKQGQRQVFWLRI